MEAPGIREKLSHPRTPILGRGGAPRQGKGTRVEEDRKASQKVSQHGKPTGTETLKDLKMPHRPGSLGARRMAL